ncbi:MAG: SDR family oxidoreductase [Verrucomicrobiaceae bacterium]|nr:MAG: SDR family oxidoreductase [Verrucomicrobiaceae bacterium]
MKLTTLITGCTSGIGLHLAKEFAKNGHDLVLVAPDAAELDSLAKQLGKEHKVRCHAVPVDLEKCDAVKLVLGSLADNGLDIGILVNNAGHGFRGPFAELPSEQIHSMIDLNIRAVVDLTQALLPAMIARGQGGILNTASVAGFEPGPTMAVYHATKAFVLSWSEAIAIELKDAGITVTALCPGATDTDFFPKAGMEDVFAFQKGNLMAPQDVAKAGYEGLMAGDLFTVPGAINKILTFGRRILPESTQAEMNRKQYEKVPPEDIKRHRGDMENARE